MSTDDGFLFWRVLYRSCEGNERWYMVRTSTSWDADMVMEQAEENRSQGGMGDEPAEILGVEVGWPDDVYTDY